MSIDVNEIASNPYLMVGSYILAFLSVVLAFVFYIKSKREKLPMYQTYSYTLIDGMDSELGELQVSYKNQPQQRVTVTKLGFWNGGRETISREDIVHSDVLRIEMPAGASLLDAKVLKSNEPSNGFKLGEANNSDPLKASHIPLSFEYVDIRNAVLIQLIHTGSAEAKIRVIGKMKGVNKIERIPTMRGIGKDHPLVKYFANPKSILIIGISSYVLIGTAGLIFLLSGNYSWYAWLLTAVGSGVATGSYVIVVHSRSPIDLLS